MSESPSTLPSTTYLNNTMGAIFMGLLIGAILYGVTLMQSYMYFRNYSSDSRSMKFMVVILWVLDTAHMVLCTISIYWYLITSYGQPEKLSETSWSMDLQTDCNGLIGLIVECFFARRVWIMSGNVIITGIIVILSLIHCSLGIVFTVNEFMLVDISSLPKLLWVTSTGLGAAAACDTLIAISMCYYLSKSRTGFQRTDSLITTLMVYSLNTGLLTSIVAFSCVILFATMNNLIWMAFFWVLGRCYVNSLLAALNSREHLRERVTGAPENSFLQLSHIQHSTSQDTQVQSQLKKPSRELAVVIETTTLSKTDYLDSPHARSRISFASSNISSPQPPV